MQTTAITEQPKMYKVPDGMILVDDSAFVLTMLVLCVLGVYSFLSLVDGHFKAIFPFLFDRERYKMSQLQKKEDKRFNARVAELVSLGANYLDARSYAHTEMRNRSALVLKELSESEKSVDLILKGKM